MNFRASLVGFATLILLLASCDKEAPVSEAPLTIHFTCDVSGRLEPCGCFTGQHGGLTRLRTWLRGEDREGRSLRFDVGGALAGKRDYEIIQYDYLLDAYAAMGFQALNLGAAEAAIPATDLLAAAEKSIVPLISASLVDPATRETLFPTHTIIQHAGRRIAVLGLLDPASCEQPGAGLAVLDMPEAIDRVLPELRENADLIFVLAFTDEPGMELLAKSYFEFDLILGGDVGQPARDLVRTNESLIAFTTNEGRTVASIDATLTAGPEPRLADPAYSVVLLYEQIPQDPELHAMVADYRREIRDTTLDIDRPSANPTDAIPGVAPAATYVGSATCQSCHPGDHAAWENTGHAHAYETLVKRGAETDPACIQCHSVGFGEPSGHQRGSGPGPLAGVGCESCHGPASEHVAEMASGRPKRFQFRPLGAADCTQCHYGEFSRPFDWEKFWPEVSHGDK